MIINLYIPTREIEHEIANKTYLSGLALYETDQQLQHYESQVDYGDKSHSSQILISIFSAFGKVCDVLSEYITNSYQSTSSTELPDSLTIDLNMPSNFNTNETDVIQMAIHKYIVSFALAEWFSLFRPKDSEYYIKNAENALLEINQALEKRKRPTRNQYG